MVHELIEAQVQLVSLWLIVPPLRLPATDGGGIIRTWAHDIDRMNTFLLYHMLIFWVPVQC